MLKFLIFNNIMSTTDCLGNKKKGCFTYINAQYSFSEQTTSSEILKSIKTQSDYRYVSKSNIKLDEYKLPLSYPSYNNRYNLMYGKSVYDGN